MRVLPGNVLFDALRFCARRQAFAAELHSPAAHLLAQTTACNLVTWKIPANSTPA